METYNSIEIRQRMVKAVNYLKEEKKITSQAYLARQMGVSPQSFTEVLSGRQKITFEFIRKFCMIGDVSFYYISTGEPPISAFGENESNLIFQHGFEDMMSNQGRQTTRDKSIRYWPDLQATAGDTVVFNADSKGEFKEMYLPNFTDCTDAIPIFGDSMFPRFKSGQIAILKPWNESFIEFGQIYLIVTRTGYCAIKYLRPVINDDSRISCESENCTLYQPFQIPKEEISKLYLVKGSVEQNAY